MDLLEVLAGYVEARRYDEAPDKPEFPEDREKIWLLLGEAETIRQAASELESDLKSAFAAQLVENETVRYGEKVYRMSIDRKERITDPRALRDWLGEDWHNVVPLTSSTALRKGGIDAVCEKRGVDREVFEETFIEVEWGDKRLKEIPMSRAPKYAQALGHGESTYGKKS